MDVKKILSQSVTVDKPAKMHLVKHNLSRVREAIKTCDEGRYQYDGQGRIRFVSGRHTLSWIGMGGQALGVSVGKSSTGRQLQRASYLLSLPPAEVWCEHW